MHILLSDSILISATNDTVEKHFEVFLHKGKFLNYVINGRGGRGSELKIFSNYFTSEMITKGGGFKTKLTLITN